jgi:hypothetical protein
MNILHVVTSTFFFMVNHVVVNFHALINSIHESKLVKVVIDYIFESKNKSFGF